MLIFPLSNSIRLYKNGIIDINCIEHLLSMALLKTKSYSPSYQSKEVFCFIYNSFAVPAPIYLNNISINQISYLGSTWTS